VEFGLIRTHTNATILMRMAHVFPFLKQIKLWSTGGLIIILYILLFGHQKYFISFIFFETQTSVKKDKINFNTPPPLNETDNTLVSINIYKVLIIMLAKTNKFLKTNSAKQIFYLCNIA
jgi:hypothetical protein